jgi:copper ion binding protein
MENITMVAPDISCEHCQHRIESALGSIDGVAAVSVDVLSKSVAVTFDAQTTSRDAIVTRLDEEGYPVAA